MIRVVPFAPEHLDLMVLQDGQPELALDRMVRGERLAATGRCFTALRARDGAPLFCGGAIATHPDYATLWAALAKDAGRAMLAIERRCRWFVASLPERRVDMIVRAGFAPAERWAARLGFAREAVLGHYFPEGDDAVIYRLQGRG